MMSSEMKLTLVKWGIGSYVALRIVNKVVLVLLVREGVVPSNNPVKKKLENKPI